MGKRTLTPHVQENILRYLQASPGRSVTALELAEELSLDRSKIVNAARLLAERKFIKKDGTLYSYVGENHNDSKSLFELLAVASNGDLVLQQDDGTVIVVRPVS